MRRTIGSISMIFGMNSASRFLQAVIVLCATGAAVAGDDLAPASGDCPGDSWTVEQAIAALKEGREPSVPFEESIYSSLLTKPLIVRGVLRFTPPSRLEKEVREPYRERYLVDGDLVTFESERKHVTKTIALDDYPGLRGFVDAFRATLSGDSTLLKQAYDTVIDGTRRKWVLRLRPRDQAGNAMVESIELSGSDNRIETMTVHAPDGDRSVMTLLRGHVP